MTKNILPETLVGEFLGVGSVGGTDPSIPLEYVKQLKVPYAYQVPALPGEDMIRQFAVLVDGFEIAGDFILDVEMSTFRDITENDEPIFIDKQNFHSLYLMFENGKYSHFKTQQTAPASMCFSTRNSNGETLVSQSMFYLYTSLMSRVAKGQVEQLSPHCNTLILCQDDPALQFVLDIIDKQHIAGLTAKKIMQKTDRIYPESVIPSYHYCYDWRNLDRNGWHVLWDSSIKLTHIDLFSYPPHIDNHQAEKLNSFMERGGALSLGLLPNLDDDYSHSIIKTLEHKLETTLRIFKDSGVSIDLISKNAMISTRCGLKGASTELSRKIHEESVKFSDIFHSSIRKFT